MQSISFSLPYTAPYDWESVLYFFRAHQLPGLESVDDCGYERVIPTAHGLGWFRVTHDPSQSSLLLSLANVPEEEIPSLLRAVRRMFDLDPDPQVIGAAMANDACLATIWGRHPGLRVSRSWSGYETILTTILGQVVSVSFGRILIGELMQAAGGKAFHPKTNAPIYLVPTPAELTAGNLLPVRTSELRKTALRAVAALFLDGSIDWHGTVAPRDLRKTLLSLPGIGAWSSEYIAMRGFNDDDAFPATDYGLKQQLKRHPEIDVNRVRPWRAYAAAALWKLFAVGKSQRYEPVV